ncbi:MAG: DUF3299 domain-containing protein [Gammaproteobacteria bacterium]|nr:DUF3299 domain-containing protein [Gammaproteobacteria bacterium]
MAKHCMFRAYPFRTYPFGAYLSRAVLYTVLIAAVLIPTFTWSITPARELQWDELMPPNWDPFAHLEVLLDKAGDLEDGSAQAEQLMREIMQAGANAPVVGELDGQRVRLPGFVVPLDFSDTQVSEFLLVPYFGACIHTPPPPANQIVYVKLGRSHPLNDIFEAVWVTGDLTVKPFYNEVGDAGYTLHATEIKPYE